jgi:rRNA processing protein Krr1/Pno1
LQTEESTQIFVPDRTVGLIIGRGGETIRDIQDKSGCHVNIVGEAKSQNGQRPVNLIGSAQASEYARRLIMEIVESDTNGGPPGPPIRQPDRAAPSHGGNDGGNFGPRITETIRVPIDAVGMIIGKGIFRLLFFYFVETRAFASWDQTLTYHYRWRNYQGDAEFNWVQNQCFQSIQSQ